MIPLNVITIVLNGRHFLDRQYEMIQKVRERGITVEWSIVEGLADLKGCTSWSVGRGGHLPDEKFHKNGRSVDGTLEWLLELDDPYVRLYEPPVVEGKQRRLWAGKAEMVNTPLTFIRQESVLMEIDVDELWTAEQVATLYRLFNEQPDRTAAWFWCKFRVGPNWALSGRGGYANNPVVEWVRAWRFKPGYFFWRHEPPVLCSPHVEGNLAHVRPFTHAETEAAGLVFDHHAYTTPESVEFKEHYYGYKGALAGWRRLQEVQERTVDVGQYLPWVPRGTMAERVD